MVFWGRLCAQSWHSSVLSAFMVFQLVVAVVQSLVHSCLRGGRQDLQMIGVDGWGDVLTQYVRTYRAVVYRTQFEYDSWSSGTVPVLES